MTNSSARFCGLGGSHEDAGPDPAGGEEERISKRTLFTATTVDVALLVVFVDWRSASDALVLDNQPNVENATMLEAFRARPHWLRQVFLGEPLADGLLEYATSREAAMLPSTVGRQRLVNPAKRISALTSNLGDFRHVLERRVREVLPDVISAIGMPLFQPTDVEIQLASHGHGAFYTRHIDTRTGSAGTDPVRRISMVYYVHRRPTAFSGGTLRLSAIAGDAFTNVEPAHDLLVAFPSWMPR